MSSAMKVRQRFASSHRQRPRVRARRDVDLEVRGGAVDRARDEANEGDELSFGLANACV